MLPGRELTIDSTLKLLLRRRWLLIVPLFLGMLGGLLYSRWQPSLYRSDAVIQVVPQRVPESYVSATVTERVEDRLRALAQQVLSRTQLEKLITDLGLFPDERRKMPMEDVIELMTKRVLIEPLATRETSRRDAQSEAFRVSFDYQDPVLAQKVVEKLASYFVDTNKLERGSQADQTSLFLESQLTDARTRLEAQEQKLKTFRERNSGRLPTQMQTNMQAIQNTQMALQAMVESLARDRDRKLMLERLNADAAADAAATRRGGGASSKPGAPSSGDVVPSVAPDATPQQRLEAARVFLTQLEVGKSPKHPDVLRVKRLIADLERQVAAKDVANLQPPASLAAEPVPERPGEPGRGAQPRQAAADEGGNREPRPPDCLQGRRGATGSARKSAATSRVSSRCPASSRNGCRSRATTTRWRRPIANSSPRARTRRWRPASSSARLASSSASSIRRACPSSPTAPTGRGST